MPALPDRLRLPLVRRFQDSLDLVTGRVLPTIERHWDNLASYDEASIEAFTRATWPTFAAVKSATFNQSTGFYSTLAGQPAPAITIREVAAQPTVRDPFISVWQALKAGRSYEEAVAAGRLRLDAVVVNLSSSTARQTGDVFARKAGLRSTWTRVPDAGACDWCELVSGQSYKTADAADFGHDRCKCTAVPDL